MHGRIVRMRASKSLCSLTAVGGAVALLTLLAWPTAAARATVASFGKTNVGGSREVFATNRKRVNEYTLAEAGTVSQLSIYLEPTTASGQQVMEGIIYADSGGAPGELLAVSKPLTFESTQTASWYPMALPVPVELAPGDYWIGVLTGNNWGVAGFRYDTVAEAKAFNANKYASGPSNPFGAFSVDSQQMSLYATYTPKGPAVPVNTSPPTISGEARQGQTLTEAHGSWTNGPTGFTYQWLQCDALGGGCLPISGATNPTYTAVAGDVGHTLRVRETASNAAGPGSPAESAQSASVLPPPPANTSPPTISGTPQQGQTLTEAHGSWTNEPSGFTYQWQSCDGEGKNCAPISGASAQSYVPSEADVGHTLRVAETASNAGGSGSATSSATAVVSKPATARFGKTTVGAVRDNGMFANYKIVHKATLSISGSVTKLSVYAIPGTKSPSPQALKAVIYGDSGGSPGALLATGSEVLYKGNVNGTGWFDMPFPSSVALTPGTYWLGFITGTETNGMGYMYDNAAGARAYNPNAYASGPTNPFGTATKDSREASIYATYVPGAPPPPPVNTSPPTISGTARQGQTLAEAHGSWTNEPTGFTYQWQSCDTEGKNCVAIAGASAQTYVPSEADVGHALRVIETASNAGGPGGPATSAATAPVGPKINPPTNTAPPTITGTAQQGKTLTEVHGTWTGEPTGFTYQWLDCDGEGKNCVPIAGATAQTYVPTEADVADTLRVVETASNAGGPGSPATSATTAAVTAEPGSSTFGKTTVGASKDGGLLANYKIVHKATLNAPGSVTKLSVYAIPGTKSPSPQSLKAVIYADSGGSPGALVATGPEVVYKGNVNGTGWFDLPFSSGVALTPGTYWLGFITGTESSGMGYVYDSVANSRAYNPNAYATGPTNPFGAATQDSQQASINATYVPSPPPPPPTNTSPPTISGTPQQGQTLTEAHGSWTGEPTSFAYQWQSCDTEGKSCASISGATAQTYVPSEADVGHTLCVLETASNTGGASSPAASAVTAVVTPSSAGVSHLEYVPQDGVVSVYDMDHEFKLLKTISMPQTKSSQVRGVMVAPSSNTLFIPHGGDGPINGSGNGGVLAYDLVGEKLLWDVKLNTGIDSGAVSPNGSKLYIPTGENDSSGIWNILSAANGEVTGTIQGGSGAHNTVASANGQFVYLGGRLSNTLNVYETATGKVKQVGPLIGSVRPLTANGKNTLAFTTATNFDGFQVSSVTTGKVLFTVSFGEVPGGFPYSAPSHGIALSPDEHTVYVMDTVHKEIQIWDVSRVSEGVAPAQIRVVPVNGLTGEASPCLYDCKRSGWVQLSRDGRFLFVGDSGDVIETATRKVITTLPTLAQSKFSIEADWQSGHVIATSTRTGVGYVE
jgi:hypothetical protein